MAYSLYERQRAFINFVAILLASVLMLNYNDLADPLADNFTTAISAAGAWCIEWNTQCGTKSWAIGSSSLNAPSDEYEDPDCTDFTKIAFEGGTLLYCHDPEQLLECRKYGAYLNNSIEATPTDENVTSTIKNICRGFSYALHHLQDDYKDCMYCHYRPSSGALFTGFFIFCQLLVGMTVFLPSYAPSTELLSPDEKPKEKGFFKIDKFARSNIVRRFVFIVISVAESCFCLGYSIMLFSRFRRCYSGKAVYLWFFVVLFVMCAVNSFMQILRACREGWRKGANRDSNIDLAPTTNEVRP
eukprot:TRINITY_DN17945_c0_g1_i1.p1 TRINITY_DN17945_c0_g1~~TRINITY_DN17945_c0_g1_i1.p1  ORF type:complete len:300 (-),score=62.37 TRINITY_DN17945_c0_g1_i1:58-957(-)